MPSRYKPIHAGRIYEQIVDQIEGRIISGELQSGDKLPTENELTQQFQVSRTAVREAMKALSLRGLIDIQPGRGTFVTADPQVAVRRSLDMMFKLNQEEGFKSIGGVRELIEPEIAALAAENAKNEQIELMRQAVKCMDETLEDPDAFVEYDLGFHLALAEATQNPLIPILIDPIIDILREHRKRIAQAEGGLERGQYYHKLILKAIEEGDSETARSLMREHIDQVRVDSGG